MFTAKIIGDLVVSITSSKVRKSNLKVSNDVIKTSKRRRSTIFVANRKLSLNLLSNVCQNQLGHIKRKSLVYHPRPRLNSRPHRRIFFLFFICLIPHDNKVYGFVSVVVINSV